MSTLLLATFMYRADGISGILEPEHFTSNLPTAPTLFRETVTFDTDATTRREFYESVHHGCTVYFIFEHNTNAATDIPVVFSAAA